MSNLRAQGSISKHEPSKCVESAVNYTEVIFRTEQWSRTCCTWKRFSSASTETCSLWEHESRHNSQRQNNTRCTIKGSPGNVRRVEITALTQCDILNNQPLSVMANEGFWCSEKQMQLIPLDCLHRCSFLKWSKNRPSPPQPYSIRGDAFS